MLYRSKKRLIQTIKYVVSIALTLFMYVVSAHKMWLPAIFEQYTGEMVRAKTIGVYSKMHFLQTIDKEDEGSLLVESGSQPLTKWDILDIITRQSDYLFVSDVLRTYRNKPTDMKKIEKNVFNVSTHTGLIEWLQNDKGKYAEIFKYEFLRYLETFPNFKDITILNDQGEIIYSSKAGGSKEEITKPSTNMQITNNIVLNKIHNGDQYVGFIQITLSTTHSEENLKLAEMPFGMTNIILNNESYVDTRNLSQEDINTLPYVVKGKYVGIRSGVNNDKRILSGRFEQGSIIIMYPKASIVFYIFKIFLYLVLMGTTLFTIFLLKKYQKQVNQWFFSSIKVIPVREKLMEESIAMQHNSIEFSKECSQKLIELKENEIQKIAVLGEHLGFLHSKLDDKTKNNLLNDSI